MPTVLLNCFISLAGVGLVLSLIAHVSSLIGADLGLGQKVFALHIGVFIVWVPTVLVFNKLTKNCKQSQLWKVALLGCPEWMKYSFYGLCVYAFINFILFMIIDSQNPNNAHGPATPQVIRGFSGHWMVFYSAAFVTLFSAKKLNLAELKCKNGHTMSPLAKYCEQCGAPMIQNDIKNR